MLPDLRRNAFRPDLADERLRGIIEAKRFVAGEKRRILSAVSSLHREPAADSGVDTQALFGEAALVFEEKDGWAWIQLTDDRYVGYVSASDLGPDDGAPTHRLNAIRTFIYRNPGIKLPTERYLGIGSRVCIVSEQGDFAELSNGGFVYRKHLREISSYDADFVAIAEQFIGVPYLWGGKSSLGIDCSGLVQLSLSEAGIAAPRDSNMQEVEIGAETTIGPNLSGLRRGDLIFWKGHVAIMLDAERIIHANGWSMSVLVEPLATAEQRIREATGSRITSIRRL